MEEPAHQTASFSIARGGPYFSAMERLGLARHGRLHRKSRALLLVTIAWLVPLVLAAAAGNAIHVDGAYLSDVGVWAKFLIAIGLFTIAEQGIDRKLAFCVSQLFSVPLIPAQSSAAGNEAITRAVARRDGPVAEAVCLLLAIVFSVMNYANIFHQHQTSWALDAGGENRLLTLAGWWTLCISNTVFWFLLLRIFWWHANWTLLMRDLAKLPLRLVATHPDGYGGIGFVNDYPNGYVYFNIGISSVVAAALARETSINVSVFGIIAGLWLAMALLFFAIPLFWFARRLTRLKRLTLYAASAAATEFERQVERKLFGHNLFPDSDEDGGPDIASDPARFYAASKKRPSMIAARTTLIPIIAATLAPIAAVGITEFPFSQLVPVIKRLLFL
ncbi:MAG: hypothetical protein KGI75_01245 [Rhizobiaceae bacterium]|nr:hypothetical protein [Rhizobiaceae bacterium]